MTAVSAPPQPAAASGRARFTATLRAEWTKFRTVRGWVIAPVVAAVLCAVFTFLVANGTHTDFCTGSGDCKPGHAFVPTGPNGEAVADAYFTVSRPLTGDGSITTQITALTGRTSTAPDNADPALQAQHTRSGLAPWAKAGILLLPSTKQGSAYAAVMATGSHGDRFQHDYTHDTAGRPGPVAAHSPRWLRLTRTGDTLTGYDSADGTTWTRIGSAHLAGLPATVSVGVFATSPVSFQQSDSGSRTLATATFEHTTVDGHAASGAWHGQSVGTGRLDFYPTLGAGGYRRSGGSLVVEGSGDIAPAIVQGLLGQGTAASSLSFGLTVALIVLIVVSALFVTVEYRRGLIRTTFAATPRRGRVLAAKAVVIGAVAFVIAAVGAAAAIPLGEHVLHANGAYVFPTGTLTVLRVIAGTGAMAAVTAVAVLALGTITRNSAAAVTGGIMVFALPSIIGSIGSGGAVQWLYRLTPAAGLSVLQALPRSAQVDYPYTFANGYYPLTPWAGLALLCGYAVLALALAAFLLPPEGRVKAELRAEWTKLRTVGSTSWLVVGAVAATVACSSAVAAGTHVSSAGRLDPTRLALTGVYLGQAVVAVLAVLAVSEEYGTGMIRVSLAAMPRRLVLLGAKAANVAALAAVAGTLAVAGCLVAGRLLLPAAGVDPAHGYPLVSISHSPTLRAAAGSVSYLVLIALLALGAATVIRDTAVSIGAVLGVLYLPPILAQAVADPMRRHLDQIAPMTAGLAIQATTDLPAQPLAPWTGLGVLTAWTAASLLTAAVLLRLRDP